MKTCCVCKVSKQYYEFYTAPRGKGKVSSRCKVCCRAHVKRWAKENAERRLSNKNRWYKENPEKQKAIQHRAYLKHRFGLSVERYDDFYQSQNGTCAICRGAEQSGRALAVDHNHTTGKIRGLLCFSCNTALGKFKDDAGMLKRAAEYVQQ